MGAAGTQGRVAFAAMHPGWADTPGLAASLPGLPSASCGRSCERPTQGIDTIVWLARHPDPAAISGRLFLDRRPRPFDRLPSTRLAPGERRRLWELVVGMAGSEDPAPER